MNIGRVKSQCTSPGCYNNVQCSAVVECTGHSYCPHCSPADTEHTLPGLGKTYSWIRRRSFSRGQSQVQECSAALGDMRQGTPVMLLNDWYLFNICFWYKSKFTIKTVFESAIIPPNGPYGRAKTTETNQQVKCRVGWPRAFLSRWGCRLDNLQLFGLTKFVRPNTALGRQTF